MSVVTAEGTLQPLTFSFKWKVEKFFTGNCQKAGDYYKSPPFPIQYPKGGSKWYLVVYPRGNEEKNKNYVTLTLSYECGSDEIAVTVNVELSIVGEENNCSVKMKDTHTFSKSQEWGWTRFIQHVTLKDTRKGYLVDDTLTVLCKVTVLPITQAVEGNDYSEWLTKIKDGLGDYEQLLESGSFADVTFNVQNKQIKSHKAILSCRSPVFKAMFEHDMKESKQNSVEVTDIDHDVMKELLRFIYSGKVKNIEQLASDLLTAADKYQVLELKALCEKNLYDMLTTDNAVEYLKLTELCDTIHLKKLVIKFTADHYKDVVKKPGFGDLNNKIMHQIMIVLAEKD